MPPVQRSIGSASPWRPFIRKWVGWGCTWRRGNAPVLFSGRHGVKVSPANVGAPDRLAFNVVGPAVNRTARIQSLSKDLGEALLPSAEIAALVARPLRPLGCFALRGISGVHEVFTPQKGL